MNLDKSYSPQNFEDDIYKWWTQNGFFTPKIDKSKKPFTIVIPPPNITGQLHIGHALDNAMQDCIIRYQRMKGVPALWVPGTDHASIATEVKIVEKLKKQGIDKNNIGREEFLSTHGSGKKNWTREAFTLDEARSKSVRHAFKTLYDQGYIYQGDRITNWCPVCKTALSDAEVEHQEKSSHFWHFKYLSADKKTEITFATTRPETMLGDTAVAVNPEDKRYKKLIGRTVLVPFVNREIPIIADDYVDKNFGTGAVKITPAHDPNDFEVGARHSLPVIRVMNDDGTMNQIAGSLFENLDRFEARKKIIAEMEKLGQFVKTVDHTHSVGECYRCSTVIEPIVSRQWFVKMKPLAVAAIEKVKNGEIKFVHKRFEKIYFNWMENIKDWCISRQLWWGHRIPVWYCDCGKQICAEEKPLKCPHCSGTSLRQDEDVLDTWFSSALWPFSTLGWPDKTADMDYFFPTNLLVTSYDIIFFWVARMIFSSLHFTGKPPFSEVLIHGLVRDSQGRKMSKSLNNGVDPLEFIEKYGADTLRFSLLNGVALDNDIRFSADKVENTRNFMNKIWNASRFVLMNLEGKKLTDIFSAQLSVADKWILSKVNTVAKEAEKAFAKHELGTAAGSLYDFMWNEFCDWYVEFSKPVLYGTDEKARTVTLSVLNFVLQAVLKMLHPFIPFITEAVYRELPDAQKTIMLAAYPQFDKRLKFTKEEKQLEQIKEIIKLIRNARTEMNVPISKRINITLRPSESGKSVKDGILYIQKLANVGQIDFAKENQVFDGVVSLVCGAAEVFIPLGELVDKEAETARLNKELEVTESEIKRAQDRLDNKGFTDKAPPELVKKEKEKLDALIEIRKKLVGRIAQLQE
ncbi:valyl-trna synthetase [Holotrichia oblita]|nr:valyl-trna synthetase [Holotrichia oblita]